MDGDVSPRDGDIFVYTDTTAPNKVYGWRWLNEIWHNAIPFDTTHLFEGVTYVFKLDGGNPSWIKLTTQDRQGRYSRVQKGKGRSVGR